LASVSEVGGLTECFSARVAAWFAGEGRAEIEDSVYLRQMNMAIALAASRWNEFAEGENAVGQMRDWLDEVERRAVARNASARADAIRNARGWFEACGGESGRSH
jgi:hypothetical protein